MIELANKIKDLVDSNLKIEIINYPDSYPEDEPTRRCPDISKIKKDLDFQPSVELDEGLIKFFKWAKDNYTDELLA